jgi:enamine deaminase RidA (YjgF/YER057c/UK114 family)/aromatic ring-opening dioxygenase catalytic subunit (LigB family)
MSVVRGYIVPHRPQPLLAPHQNPGYADLRRAMEQVAAEIAALDVDLLLLYSTRWVSILGHQLQADPNPRWTHVDDEFHDLGTIPYAFRMDPQFAEAYAQAGRARGLHCRTVATHGFPIDTGTIMALSLLNPGNRLPACVVSCNMYADRAETLVLGKAANDALKATGKRAVALSITALSNRMFTELIDPAQDHISSAKDDEWNRKLLEFLGEGRLEDVSQLARSFTSQANADSKCKAIWWLGALMGQHNRYEGEVLSYQALYGTGAAVVRLVPSLKAAKDQEFDEDDTEFFHGDRGVLQSATPGAAAYASAPLDAAPVAPVASKPPVAPVASPAPSSVKVNTAQAPKPVGAYPHARREGEWLFLSGVGPRQPGTDAIPGGPVWDAEGKPLPYDVEAQTRAVIKNVQVILEASGATLKDIVDCQVYLIDMRRDFPTFNKVYAELLGPSGATRTTVEVRALPTPIAVELKVVARLKA